MIISLKMKNVTSCCRKTVPLLTLRSRAYRLARAPFDMSNESSLYVQFCLGGIHDQWGRGRPENRPLKGCLTYIFRREVASL
jgi:hypothetical protein